jgi:AcrR family transcriptional regulator
VTHTVTFPVFHALASHRLHHRRRLVRIAAARRGGGGGVSPSVASRREQSKAQNRAAILAAAGEAFASLGYGATTVRDIVRRSDLAAGTFYNYFPDKESVFRALVDEHVVPLRAAVREARSEGATLESFVRSTFRACFALIAADPALLVLLQRNADAIRTLIGTPVINAGVDELLEDVHEAIEHGELPPIDAEYLTGAMTGVAFELAIRMVEREPPDVDGAAQFAADLFLGGIARMGGDRR